MNMENSVKSGVPVNTKSLLAFIFNQMDMLNKGQITSDVACAQAKLAAQANNVLSYELKRTAVECKLKELGCKVEPKLREIESKPFDDTINNA